MDEGRPGEMEWYYNYKEIRLHPETIFEGSRSVLVLGTVYRDSEYDTFIRNHHTKIARYAVGKDYHKVLRKKGARLLRDIQEEYPGITGRVTVDSAPVPEKIFAVRAGLGFRGRNTNVIHPGLGSYIFLTLIFLTLESEFDAPLQISCAGCNLCVVKCPGNALDGSKIEPTRCISYYTTEKKSDLTDEEISTSSPWLMGCDVCQEVCPHNLHAAMNKVETRVDQFRPVADIMEYLRNPHEFSQDEWDEFRKGKPAGRMSLVRWNSLLGKNYIKNFD